MVTATGDTRVTSVWREQSRHTHRWLVGRPDGTLSGGVCKGCGAHRDFMEGKKRFHVREAQPLESLVGAWLAANEGALDEAREVSMTSLIDDNERQAQRIACTHLIRGCENAVSDLLVAMGEVDSGAPAMRRAREILAGMLSSWHETLRALTPREAPVA